MELAVAFLTVLVYGLAIYQGVRERTALYVVALLAGQVSTLAAPLWQLLYQFRYDPGMAPLLSLLGHPLPRAVALGGWALTLPPLLVIALSQRRVWFTSYAGAVLLFALFLIVQIAAEAIGTRSRWWEYTAAPLPLDFSSTLLAAIMNALVTLGCLAAIHLNRHYTIGSLLLFLLPIPLVLRLLVSGLLGAPLYTILLIRRFLPELAPQSWAGAIAVVGTLALLAWGVHLVAETIARQGDTYEGVGGAAGATR